jgi:uncharacterized membrane protein YgcG
VKKILFYLFLVTLFLVPAKSFARTNVDYWYIKNFDSEINVNNDSSIDITENITADCGIAEKHGIFRVLPTFQQISTSERINSPIALTSITDFNDKPIKYTTTNDRANHTITWKIGDANQLVTGVNYYRIKYHVKNAARHNSSGFDELYWNLSGNYWDIAIDKFSANINFPDQITKENTRINVYSGALGEKNSLNIVGSFSNTNQISVSYDQTMEPGTGITLSATFPKNIISPYVPTFWEKNGQYFALLIPLFVLWLCLKLWNKFGKDPNINPTIAPEFEIPESLSPIDMGVVYTDGILKNNFLSAAIINLAVKGYLKIEKLEKNGVFSSEDYKLSKSSGKKEISQSEKSLYNALLGSRESVKISDLKNEFYTNIPAITDASKDYLVSKKWLVRYSRVGQVVMLIVGVGALFLSFFSFTINSILGLSILISSIILIIFSFLMTRRTPEEAELLRRIKGFKLYMTTAEKYRQKFNEKEDIFETFLPYAIMFGLTTEWIRKMRDIYGEKYFATYHPIWYIGGFGNFNIDNLSSEISQMSSSMASSITSAPSSSGSGGGGFSGGGGGGGGGGGW